MPRPAPVLRDSSVQHPIPVPQNATHFMLRKGGKKAPECLFVDANGITVAWHPISDFDKDTITSRWGFSPVNNRDYWVMFAKETEPGRSPSTMGTFRSFGIEGETIVTDETGTEIVPGYPDRTPAPTSMGDMLAGLAGLKSLVDAEANARVQEARLSHESTLASTREANANVLQIMTMFMKEARPAPAPPAADPMLLALLTKIDSRLTALEGDDDYEDEPEPEEVDYKKYARLVKDVRRDGMGALMAFAKDEGAMALVEALPTLKARLPDIMMMLKPLVEQAFASMTGRGQAPPVHVQTVFRPPSQTVSAMPSAGAAGVPNGFTVPSPPMPANAAGDVELEPEADIS